jgi:hypothetical protein
MGHISQIILIVATLLLLELGGLLGARACFRRLALAADADRGPRVKLAWLAAGKLCETVALLALLAMLFFGGAYLIDYFTG